SPSATPPSNGSPGHVRCENAAPTDGHEGVAMSRLVLTNANVLDGEHPAVAGRTVVIEDTRIASVSAEPVDPRAGDDVVDLAGRTVMPGMATCHFHSTYHDLGATQAPYGSEHPPAYLALLSHANLMKALRCGYTVAVGAGAGQD